MPQDSEARRLILVRRGFEVFYETIQENYFERPGRSICPIIRDVTFRLGLLNEGRVRHR